MTIQAVNRSTCQRCGKVEEELVLPERVTHPLPHWGELRLLINREKSCESHEIDLCPKCSKEAAKWAKMKFRRE